jgi:hypothetical protein
MQHELTTDILKFITAGKAIFTIKNEQTGNRFTYRVKKAKPRNDNKPSNLWFVSVLTGSNNESDYTYIGLLKAYNNLYYYEHGGKSSISPKSQSALVFNWYLQKLQLNTLPPFVRFFHNGYCGRCGHLLTVPESIEKGLGPECTKLQTGPKKKNVSSPLSLYN